MVRRKRLTDNTVPAELVAVEIDPKIYNEVARCAELLSVQLIDSIFSIAPSFFDAEAAKKPRLDFSALHASFDPGERVVTSIFYFESYIKVGRKKVFSLKDKFVVFYGVAAGCDETHAVAFAKKTGLMACYPYFRSHVASTAALANADVPILPTISSPPVQAKVKEPST